MRDFADSRLITALKYSTDKLSSVVKIPTGLSLFNTLPSTASQSLPTLVHPHITSLSIRLSRFEAELREDIRPAIPKIVAVLISNPGARKAALISLSRLADTGRSSIFPSLQKRTHKNLKPIGATSAQWFPLSLRRSRIRS